MAVDVESGRAIGVCAALRPSMCVLALATPQPEEVSAMVRAAPIGIVLAGALLLTGAGHPAYSDGCIPGDCIFSAQCGDPQRCTCAKSHGQPMGRWVRMAP